MKNKWILKTILLFFLLTGCAASEAEPTAEVMATAAETAVTESTEPAVESTAVPNTAEVIEETTSSKDPIAEFEQTLTLPQKVGQLFVIRPDSLVEGSDETCITAVTDAAVSTLSECPPGGIAVFDQNIESPEQLKKFTSDLQEHSGISLFMAVDEEGGPVSRLANHGDFKVPRFPSASRMDPAAMEQIGSDIGNYLEEYGFNVDFAPVADVNTNPKNPVIGKRAFSGDPEIVAQCVRDMAAGLRSQGITPVFKHFPGHGDTRQDSHKELAFTDRTAEQMENCEWISFRQAGAQDMIMAGHIAAPEVTGDQVPASLSYPLITEILKENLGFQGLVITDSLEMEAITKDYTPGQAALAALQAGCDLILMPERYREAFFTVLEAVQSGQYPMEQLDETVTKILRFKAEAGIWKAE